MNPGDEVVVFEPFYENYGPDAILSRRDSALRHPALRPTGPSTRTSCASAFTEQTRAIVVNTPAQPDRQGLHRARSSTLIAGLCREHDVLAITDDIYQHIVFEGEHVPLATLPGMAERTIAIVDVEDVLGDRLARRLDDRQPAS